MKGLITIILGIFLLTSCTSNRVKTCHLYGKVIERNSRVLILKKQTEDSRYAGVEIKVDSSGNFNYDMNYQFVEAYELIFKDELEHGSWRPILFFPDNDKIEFTLYSMEKADSNKIEGSILSLKELDYNQIIMERYYNKYVYWHQKIDSLENIGKNGTDHYNAASDTIKVIEEEVPLFEFQYLTKQVNIYGYSKLLSILRTEKDRKLLPIDSLKKYNNLFQQKFPNHPYNEIAQFRLDGLTNIKVGGNFVNFTAKDSMGNNITLSEFISENKLTLIDLWSPWCGPCIRESQKVVPIYEEFKNSGFGVIGVIGGIKNQEQFLHAIRNHNYPWTQLAEIKDVNRIWEKYGISQSGGSIFLVDNKGKIRSINPNPEEIKKLIMEE